MSELNNEIKPVENIETDNKEKKEEPSFLKTFLVDLVIAGILAFAIVNVVRPTIVKQTSMQDTFQPNDYVIMYKLAYAGDKTPQRGDVVVFQSDLPNEETGKDKLLIKRVIGLPGDTIQIKNGKVLLNGKIYQEDYIKDGYTPAGNTPAEGEIFTVPDEEYFCMGDNRVVSLDSRYSEVGTVTEEQMVGKAVLRLYPFNKIKRF